MEPFEIVVFRQRHNPYFNRWFSAINDDIDSFDGIFQSQSLF